MNSEPKRILIVEDDPGLALLFGEHLRRMGCKCDTVATAQACIAWLGGGIPDLLVLDYSLPDMLAPALVEELRRIGRLPAFVVVTGHGDERVAVELMKLGARDYLVKDHFVFDRLPVVVLRALQDVEKERRLAATEAALLASEARLRRAEIVGGFGHWELDIEKGIIRGSAGARRIYGLDGDFWPIEVPQGCVLPAYRPVLDAQFQQLIAGEAPYDAEYEIRRYSDGQVITVHSTATYDPFTRTVFGIIQDTSERKRMELALKESEERMRVTLAITQIGVWDWDLANDRWFASPTFFSMLGYEPETGPAKRAVWLERLHPEDHAVVAAKIAAVLAGGSEDYQYEARIRHADGSYRWHQVRGHAVKRDPAGRALRLVGIRLDITERRQVEEALRQKTALLEAQLNSSLDGILVVDGQGKKVLQNRRAAELWKVPAAVADNPDDQVQVRHVMRMTKNPEQFVAGVAHLYGHPQETSRDEVELVDGTVLDRYSAPVLGQDGRYYGRIWVFRDITERKRAEETLRESLHEKEALLKEVHHRVKNNLQVITSLLRLQAGQSGSPGTREVLRDMQNRIRSMALLHETLYRSGNLARVDLADYIQNVCTQLLRSTTQFEAGTIRLQFDLASVEVVATQAVPCGLLVNELVSNCLKHAFPDGRSGVVSVSIRREAGGDCVRIQVADDGVGLPADFAVGKLQTLGLHLVSDLSRQLDGVLAIGPGPGAQFVVTFAPTHPALPDRR